MRPVPVVFLRLAFSLQLSVSRACVSLMRARGCRVRSGQRTLSGLGGGVAARSAGVLLDVKRAATCRRDPKSAQLIHLELSRRVELTASSAQNVRLVVALAEAGSSLGCSRCQSIVVFRETSAASSIRAGYELILETATEAGLATSASIRTGCSGRVGAIYREQWE